MALKFSVGADEALSELSKQLGISARSLKALGAGWSSAGQCWTFPERGADGTVIGINGRYRDGAKRRFSGCRAGLTFTADWDKGEGPILLVEGASDTAALIDLGLNVVGRPSCNGGADLLGELLKNVHLDRHILVIGERDQKPTGLWPGREGAIRIAKKLSESLSRPISWSLPPDSAKDARQWLISQQPGLAPRLAAMFLSGLAPTIIAPPERLRREGKIGPARHIDEWRAEMVQARLTSLSKPGYYLDSSPTGAGKSYADLAAIKSLLAKEAA